jgi:hypothetical protein
MEFRAGVGARKLGTRVFLGSARCGLLLCLLALSVAAQAGKDGPVGAAEESFKNVDPYTKGDPEVVQRAGYVRLAPFQWGEGIQSQEVIEVLGGVDLLWAETAHFKICSNTKTYNVKIDSAERDRLDDEFALLAKKLPGFKAPRGAKLDPWLRLHLYAQRLELLYEEFCARTGFSDADFVEAANKPGMGSGPYLGQKMKMTVLLAEKSSALGRFHRRFLKIDEEKSYRYMLPGGAMYLGISAEAMRENGYELDTALYCAVSAGIVGNLLDGLRDSYWSTPMWLDIGLGHWFSRRIDERFTYYAAGTTRHLGDDLHEWQPRVRGLVSNDFEYSWNDMLNTLEWAQFTPQNHMLIWSRVDWMLQVEGAKLRDFLLPLTERLPPGSKQELATLQVERAKTAFQAGFGMSSEECEAAWGAWVKKTYARK